VLEIKYNQIAPILNERQRRIWAGTECAALRWGGIAAISRVTGLSPSTVRKGYQEIRIWPAFPDKRIRKKGAGRYRLELRDPTLRCDLLQLVDPEACGDPQSPLLWTNKSLPHLRDALIAKGHHVSVFVVRRILHEAGYSLQKNRKNLEKCDHPDRNAQFEHINRTKKEFEAAENPYISVDTKKKELVGNYENKGEEWRPKCQPRDVNGHDFPDPEKGKAAPYGVYDIHKNHGFVNVGRSGDTGAFACESIKQWWFQEGIISYPKATNLLITADGGGSNGSRNRLWKTSLQQLANETNLQITVCHYPPGCSKYNPIEHRLFSAISGNWPGHPLESFESICQLITNTTTKTGLTVTCILDAKEYKTGIKISDQDMEKLILVKDPFHGDWNYIIKPQT
jgi:hypothetical protein